MTSKKQAPGAALVAPYRVRQSHYYTHVAQSSGRTNITMTAGQIGIRPDQTIPEDPDEQVELAVANLSQCLQAAGARVEDVIKLTYYIVNFDHATPRHRRPVMDFLEQHRPPTTLVPVTKLAMPGLIFEIEATAAIPQYATEKVDVVVVGGGLSGLQAALDLHKAGLSVKVLEARDRVGGKTWSKAVDGGFHDVGAAWINDSNQSKMYALAQRYSLDLIKQNTEGNIIVDDGIGQLKQHPYGQLLPNAHDEAQIQEVIRVRDIFESTCQQIDIGSPVASGQQIRKDIDELTFEEWIRSLNITHEDAANALKVGARAMLGVEPSEMSALYFLDYCKSGGGYMTMRSDSKHGGQYLRVAQGTQSFSDGLANELPPESVMLMSPVRRIEQTDGRVRVVSARGVYEASRVIVSVPTPLYKEITFDPPLPAEKREMAASTKLGDYCKSIALYEKPWWRDAGFCGLAQSCHGPFAVTRDTSNDSKNSFSLTCFVVGKPARDWMALRRADRDQAVLDQIQRLYGRFTEVPHPKEIVEQIWANEQWSQGCPCPVMPPGGLSAFESVLRAPVGKLHFVGTETGFEWKGYMEGAVRSGERGAQEVLSAMNKARL